MWVRDKQAPSHTNRRTNLLQMQLIATTQCSRHLVDAFNIDSCRFKTDWHRCAFHWEADLYNRFIDHHPQQDWQEKGLYPPTTSKRFKQKDVFCSPQQAHLYLTSPNPWIKFFRFNQIPQEIIGIICYIKPRLSSHAFNHFLWLANSHIIPRILFQLKNTNLSNFHALGDKSVPNPVGFLFAPTIPWKGWVSLLSSHLSLAVHHSTCLCHVTPPLSPVLLPAQLCSLGLASSHRIATCQHHTVALATLASTTHREPNVTWL